MLEPAFFLFFLFFLYTLVHALSVGVHQGAPVQTEGVVNEVLLVDAPLFSISPSTRMVRSNPRSDVDIVSAAASGPLRIPSFRNGER